ncbi:uncharacterized protein C6G9.01c [Momordica charantia]|uniref:Uncharacterized protein C6G9.01c n=1 Tax=Momordica charantia TaxID=3673 RepID=A0A6J1CKT3_MOMCH|nr:uncharacterized protein C6G9.01c [Momordica charantia]
MPKKKSSKKPKEVQENAATKEEKPDAVVKEEKPPSAKKSSEIDEIFAGKKRKKPEVEKAEKPKLDTSDRPKMKNKKKRETVSKDGFSDPPSRSRKRTGDGLAIYTEEELGFGNADAGGTPLCPFDCSCCF